MTDSTLCNRCNTSIAEQSAGFSYNDVFMEFCADCGADIYAMIKTMDQTSDSPDPVMEPVIPTTDYQFHQEADGDS